MNYINSHIKNYRDSIGRFIINYRLKNKNFTIISNDCWGGEVYKSLNLKYNTPFVGLMILSPCYIKLLENLPYYMSEKLQFVDSSKYEYINEYKKQIGIDFPIGVLGNEIEIHFLHYSSKQEALEKWNRRTKRINWNNIFLKYDSNKDLANKGDLKRFDLLRYSKVSFGVEEDKNINYLIKVDNWTLDAVKFFYMSLKYFDVIDWLNGGSGKRTFLGKFNYYLFPKSR